VDVGRVKFGRNGRVSEARSADAPRDVGARGVLMLCHRAHTCTASQSRQSESEY